MKEKKDYHYCAGWDHFTPDPGEKDKMFCRVCAAEMDVKRNVNGPTSSIESMGGGKHPHDSFSCPNTKYDWNSQVRTLKARVEKETSQFIADILEQEIEKVLKEKKTTREQHWRYI